MFGIFGLGSWSCLFQENKLDLLYGASLVSESESVTGQDMKNCSTLLRLRLPADAARHFFSAGELEADQIDSTQTLRLPPWTTVDPRRRILCL